MDPIVIGVALFGLLVAPIVTYVVLSWWARLDMGKSASREETAPSTTQAYPSRTIPGGKQRDD